MSNHVSLPLTRVKDYYRKHYGVLSDYVPELIAMRAGLRQATQLSLNSDHYGRERPRLESFCDRTGLSLRTYERRGWVKILLSTESATKLDPKDEDRLGDLFGYPDCCVGQFTTQHETQMEPFINHMAPLLANHERLDFRTNLFLRTSPLHLVRHFPCALDCPETLRKADQLLQAIGNHNKRLHSEIVHFGQSPVLFLDVCGAGIVFEGTIEGNRLRYTDSHCPIEVAHLLPLSAHNTETDCELFDEIAKMLERGDELLLEPGELLIHQQGRWLATFPRPDRLSWRLLRYE